MPAGKSRSAKQAQPTLHSTTSHEGQDDYADIEFLHIGD